ncbi:hypothetical protein AJ80_01613 [Polytolypa hystricis UAMH7299]|uniref:Fluoroacetyl-CoA-specific thioesterase-like domain-containing protein n=1 Tax=Polytolypa hystricis (strain UAMH7299) TaxID=1447883 RepID=A0A2B7Z1F8_POLH7|nr:hypothetical protein AJ80_01613 [Polytolypa hystricis UAMH7299]
MAILSREPAWNESATVTTTVASNDLASALPLSAQDGTFPAVLSTPRMIALMEIACNRLLAPYLSAQQTSVVVRMDVSHSAASPLGTHVTATARYLGKEGSAGKLYKFEAVVSDRGGEIGRSQMTRAVVAISGVESRARDRTRCLFGAR